MQSISSTNFFLLTADWSWNGGGEQYHYPCSSDASKICYITDKFFKSCVKIAGILKTNVDSIYIKPDYTAKEWPAYMKYFSQLKAIHIQTCLQEGVISQLVT